MDKIALDIIFEFAKDLRKIFEILQKEENLSNPFKSSELAESLSKKSSQLTKQLYNKYKGHLDLKLRNTNESINLEFRNISNELILIPEHFIHSFNSKDIVENFDILLILMRNRNLSWEDFSFRLTQLFSYSKNKIKTINASTLEKIRFFMSFINEYPDYITETPLPVESKFKEYKSRYTKWGRTKTFYNIFNRFLTNDTNFFNHHLRINPIPNYNAWNLNILFCENDQIDQFPENATAPIYPLQVFENIDHSFNSILFLMDQQELIRYKSLKRVFSVEKFSIINNFNVFEKNLSNKPSINLELRPIFKSFVDFIDDYNNNKTTCISSNKTYEFVIDFKKKCEVINDVNLIKNKETVKKFNLKYKEKNDFNELYSTYKGIESNPYRILFKNRYSFPDFNQITLKSNQSII